MVKFRKKAVVIEAEQYLPEDHQITSVNTLEGNMLVNHGDWIITGVKGEKYPCRDDIFKLTYESV